MSAAPTGITISTQESRGAEEAQGDRRSASGAIPGSVSARRGRNHAALHLAAQTLASLARLALALDARLLVEPAALELLQDALLGHLLLEDLHRLLEAVANLDLYGFAERILHGERVGT